jgi:hypothetical protein
VLKQKCHNCNTEFCACCGESYSNRDAKPGIRLDILFHCSDLQGVIIGMGLFMIDMTFETQQSQRAANEPTSKQKRKSMEVDRE